MIGSHLRKLMFPALALSLLLFQTPGVATAQGYLVVHSFDSPLGSNPQAPLLQSSGTLYGTTAQGGANSQGTVFKMDADGNNFAVLHHFNTTDGSEPESGLILASNGLLYGTTTRGGASLKGTIFKIDTAGNNFSTIRHLDGDNDGEDPVGRLVQADDTNLYGVTNGGGANNFGTLYRIDLNGTTFTVIHVFGTSTEGTEPGAGVIQASDGLLYGTTNSAAAGIGDGTVFRCGLDGSGFTTLHTFAGPPNDGQTPSAELLEASDGVLYGTTEFGGTQNSGTAFMLHRDGAAYQKLHDFGGADGVRLRAPLVEDEALLWGTAYAGGANNGGTLFHLTRAGGLFDVVHNYALASGEHARGAVLVGSDRALYGTAENGGANGGGVAFRFTNPTVLAIVPSSGPAAGGTPVTIIGTLFQNLASVTIGGSIPTGVAISPTEIDAVAPALPPGTVNVIVVTNPDETIGSLRNGFFADFLDVPDSDLFHGAVESLVRYEITAGCGGGNYCRNNPVTRAQMAVFLLKGKHYPLYAPPPCTGVFADVECSPTPAFAVDWIEQLAAEGITGGCGGGNYCPANPVTRAQMAVFLLKGTHGSAYTPPPCTGLFADVACSPTPDFAVDWIEQLYNEGITGGCATNPLRYCPGNPVTRGQMAVFLDIFDLPPL